MTAAIEDCHKVLAANTLGMQRTHVASFPSPSLLSSGSWMRPTSWKTKNPNALDWQTARRKRFCTLQLLEAMMSLTAFLPPPPTAMSLPTRSSRESKPSDPVNTASAASFRQQVTAAAPMVVVKVGTRVLTQPDGTLNHKRIEQLAEEIHAMHTAGRRTVLVSSGAVGAGVGLLGLKARPTDLAKLQAVAAVGRTHLNQSSGRCFAK